MLRESKGGGSFDAFSFQLDAVLEHKKYFARLSYKH
jgi:hypothetical protein